MKILSLFDGMSCGQLALNKIGIVPEMYFASEIKPHGIKVTQDNFPNTIQIGDVNKVRFENGVLYTENGNFEVGEIDLLIGGSPCQNFSIACITEKRLGLEGEKSSLFYQYLRILKEVEPKNFLLENVGSMKDKDKEEISKYLGCEPIQINSNLVSAQIRDRVYWTSIQVEELPQDKRIFLKDVLESGYSPREKALCLLEGYSRPTKTPYRKMRRHAKALNTLIFKDEQHYKDCMEFYNNHFKGLAAKDADEVANKIDCTVFDGVRDLSKLEMERLQTVPEGYTKAVTRNESASLLGDGWTVDVIAHIFKYIK